MSLDFWNQRYATEDYVFGTSPNVFLQSQANRFTPGQRVLAVADGEGRNSVWLAEQGLDVHAIDGSPVALAKAARLAAERGVNVAFEPVDVFAWDWPVARYDAVVAIFIQFAPPGARERLVAHLRDSVAPGGVLLLQGYTPRQIAYGTGGPSDPANLYTEADLRGWFGDWQIEHLREHDSVIEEGAGHSGMSALIDLVARRPRN
jgi:SAM-dependent methyltransferase